MNKDSAQATETTTRKYEAPRLVDYGRLHSQTTGGTGHANEHALPADPHAGIKP
jgi:hypothetical protein